MSQVNISYSSLETQRKLRIEKMHKLEELGQDTFTPDSTRNYSLNDIKKDFDTKKTLKSITLAGRIKSKRTSGKIAFATVEDESLPSGFQFIFKKDQLPEEGNENKLLTFANFKELFEEGDYIQATGYLSESQRGEPSLFVHQYQILTKALRPLPEKLEDVEQRFRQRYVDMKLNPEVREILQKKSKFWTATKNFMDNKCFTQVEAPIMQETTGGAEAEPFTTYHKALDQEFYLGISPELHLKRFIVGGFEKVYDIGRNFRNEGIDDEHLQEFSRIEFYWAYANNNDLLSFCEELIKYVITETFGTTRLIFKPKNESGKYTGEEITVEWSTTWSKMSYFEFIKHYGNIDLKEFDTVEKLQELCKKLEIDYESTDSRARLMDKIYKKVARPKCIEPTWVIDIPVELSPLAKRDPNNPEITQRSHLLAYGSELTNGFSELNNPLDQLERFQEQQKARDAGDAEAMMIDLDYVTALEYAMPPTAGFAYSERLFSILSNQTIRECTPFPLMRKDKGNEFNKSKKTMVAHSVILNNSDIPLWSKLNIASHLSASFAARRGKELIHINKSLTKDKEVIPMNIQHAIVVKQVATYDELSLLKIAADSARVDVVVFTEDMQQSSNDEKVQNSIENKASTEIKYLGILVYGKKSDVEELTDHLDLLG
ncbi:MAG: lysine--tRNA ligase [Patescibacteria group bacterium]